MTVPKDPNFKHTDTDQNDAVSVIQKRNIFFGVIIAVLLMISVIVGFDSINYRDQTKQLNRELILKEAKIQEQNKKIESATQTIADYSARLEKQDPHKSIVDFIKRKQPKLDPKLREMYATIISKYSKKFGFPPELVASVAFRESAFHEGARSSVKCFGLMQINPIHTDKFKQLGITLDEAHYIDNNVHLGCIILREYFDKTKDIRKALLKYVGGNLPSYVHDILGYTVDALIIDKVDLSQTKSEESWKESKKTPKKPTKSTKTKS